MLQKEEETLQSEKTCLEGIKDEHNSSKSKVKKKIRLRWEGEAPIGRRVEESIGAGGLGFASPHSHPYLPKPWLDGD